MDSTLWKWKNFRSVSSLTWVLWILRSCQALLSREWITVEWKQEQRAAVKMSTGHWQLTWPLPSSFCDFSTTFNKVGRDLWNGMRCYNMCKLMCARVSTASTSAPSQDGCCFRSQPKLFPYHTVCVCVSSILIHISLAKFRCEYLNSYSRFHKHKMILFFLSIVLQFY